MGVIIRAANGFVCCRIHRTPATRLQAVTADTGHIDMDGVVWGMYD